WPPPPPPVVAAPLVGAVLPGEHEPAAPAPPRTLAGAAPRTLPLDLARQQIRQERRQVDVAVGVVLRRLLRPRPLPLVHLLLDPDLRQVEVLLLKADRLRPPHARVGDRHRADELVWPLRQQRHAFGHQPRLQRGGPQFLALAARPVCFLAAVAAPLGRVGVERSEEHTSELQSREKL